VEEEEEEVDIEEEAVTETPTPTPESAARNSDLESPESAHARLQAEVAEAESKLGLSLESLRVAKLRAVLHAAMAERGSSNAEQASIILSNAGKLTLDEKDTLTVRDPGDLDPDLVLDQFQREVPHLFGGPAKAGPRISKEDSWRQRIRDAR
jgi:hypothetical protein